MKSEPRQAQLRAWILFLQAYGIVTGALETELQAERDMPLAWYDVLVQLSSAQGGRMRMQELAESVLLSKSGLTRLFDRMEHEGLVRREPCVDDRRGTLAVLTPAGKSSLRRAAPVHLRGVERYFGSQLTDDEARAMQNALRKVLRAAGREPRVP